MMADQFHLIAGKVRFLTLAEGGRQHPVRSGYRGQFYYEGQDHDAIWHFPDACKDASITAGATNRVVLALPIDRWQSKHSNCLREGMSFQGREGAIVVAEGIIEQLDGVDLQLTGTQT